MHVYDGELVGSSITTLLGEASYVQTVQTSEENHEKSIAHYGPNV